jgi:hypothetical protein
MNELPMWPPIAALVFAIVSYVVMRIWSYRLDRQEEEAARRKQGPAE